MAGKFLVYEHVFPNGKKYIGITSNAKARFRNGKGYETQRKIDNAIDKYGWDNIQHNIIVDGLEKKQAERLEKYLIAELHTIDDGYNTSPGGEKVNGFYLNAYVLSMLGYVSRHKNWFADEDIQFTDLIYGDRNNKEASDFWNEAERAVTLVHGHFSATDEVSVKAFFFHMFEYFKLWLMMQRGEDISNWKEAGFEQKNYDSIFRANEV